MIRVLRFAPMLLLLSACKKEEPPPPSVAVVAPAPAATSAEEAAADPPVDLESLPVEEDFEEEAEKEVTAATLVKKLDELEKEIESE